jgi:hypothetical protein
LDEAEIEPIDTQMCASSGESTGTAAATAAQRAQDVVDIERLALVKKLSHLW